MGPKNDCIAGAKMIIFKLSQQVPDFLDEEYKPDFKLAIARCRKAVDRLDTWEAYFSSAPAQELENSFLDLTDALNAWDVRMSGKQDINNRLTSFFMELGKEMRDLMEHISKLTAMVTFGAVVGSASVYFAKFITATLRALVSFPGYAISFLTGVLVGIGLTATAAYWVSLVVVVLVVAGTSCAVLMLVWQCVKMFVESFIGVAFSDIPFNILYQKLAALLPEWDLSCVTEALRGTHIPIEQEVEMAQVVRALIVAGPADA